MSLYELILDYRTTLKAKGRTAANEALKRAGVHPIIAKGVRRSFDDKGRKLTPFSKAF
jgi:hypothetical protein